MRALVVVGLVVALLGCGGEGDEADDVGQPQTLPVNFTPIGPRPIGVVDLGGCGCLQGCRTCLQCTGGAQACGDFCIPDTQTCVLGPGCACTGGS